MTEKRRASEVRQVELTDAALRIIASKGIASLSTRRLAEEVGLSTGAIFKHFPSLDALLEALVARVEAVLDATYPEPSLPPLERLERFIETRSSAVGQRLGILRLVLSDQFMLALPAQGSQRLGACVQKTRAFIIECVRTGQAAGEIRADLPAEPLAVLVMGTVQMLALAPSNPERRLAAPQLIIETLLALLRPLARPPERAATKPRGTPKPSGARAKRLKS